MTRREKRFTAFFVQILVPRTVAVTLVTSNEMAGSEIKFEWSQDLDDSIDFSRKNGNLIVAVANKGDFQLDASDPDVKKIEPRGGGKVTYTHRSYRRGNDITVTAAPLDAPIIWIGDMGPVLMP